MITERGTIIKSLGKYFHIKELACPHVYQKFGERAWQFFDTNALYLLLLLRETILHRPMYVNNYERGYTQRGLRCNKCEIVKSKATVYLSQHLFGKAWDFTVQGMTAEEARRDIIANADIIPFPVRLEKGKPWVHIDTMEQWGVTDKVYEFNA